MSNNSAMRTAFGHIESEYRSGGLPADPFAERSSFRASRAFDKLIVLVTIAVASAAVGYLAVPANGVFGFALAAFVVVVVGWVRPQWAKVLAPLYSVLEGVALGVVSGAYATLGGGIVPLAVVFTAAVYFGCLITYRTGLVKVTPRWVSLAQLGAVGLLAVAALSFLGLTLHLDSLGPLGLLFTALAFGIAVLNLFADFEWVQRCESMGVSDDAEWAAAFAMMTALVLVYLSMLRTLAAVYGGGSRRR